MIKNSRVVANNPPPYSESHRFRETLDIGPVRELSLISHTVTLGRITSFCVCVLSGFARPGSWLQVQGSEDCVSYCSVFTCYKRLLHPTHVMALVLCIWTISEKNFALPCGRILQGLRRSESGTLGNSQVFRVALVVKTDPKSPNTWINLTVHSGKYLKTNK